MKEVCLVDTSWLLNRSFYAFKDFKDSNGNPIGDLFGATNFVKTIINKGLPTIFCLDSKSDFRKRIDESYKANRESLNLWKHNNDLAELCRGINGIAFAQADGYEADDVIFSLAKQYSDLGFRVIVYSSDNDMLQTLQFPNVCVSKKITQNEIEIIEEDSDYYRDNYPVHPDRLAIYRAFKGDASDNLSPVVPRMPTKIIVPLTNLIQERVDCKLDRDEILKVIKSFTWTETQLNWINKFEENIDKFISNYRVMKLNPIEFRAYYKVGNIQDTIELAKQKELYQYSEFLTRMIGGK